MNLEYYESLSEGDLRPILFEDYKEELLDFDCKNSDDGIDENARGAAQNAQKVGR